MNNKEKVNYLLSKYGFPDYVLRDINQRIGDCMMSYNDEDAQEHYIGQQVRFLDNILKSQKIKVTYKEEQFL